MLPLFASVLPVIILFCGLALDTGMLELKTLQMQNAADAGALGAELEWERGTGNWLAQARADASVNGFTDGSNNVTVTALNPATAGAYAGHYDAIQVTVTQKVQTIFMGTLKGGAVTMSVTAVALVTPCAYVTGLDPTLSVYPLQINSSPLSATSCPMYVNTGVQVDSTSSFAGSGEYVDGPAGGSDLQGSVTTPPVFNSSAMADPLAGIVSPSYKGCDFNSYSLSSGTATLGPGTYCNGMQLTNSTVTLSPGLYILTGTTHWSASTVTGNGVTIFMTHGDGVPFGLFRIDLGSTVNWSAPVDDSHNGIPGILLFTDRTWVTNRNQYGTTTNQDFQCNGATIIGDGIWYTTGTGIYFYKCTFSAPHYTSFVGDNLVVQYTPFTLASDFSSIETGNPFRTRAVLVQ